MVWLHIQRFRHSYFFGGRPHALCLRDPLVYLLLRRVCGCVLLHPTALHLCHAHLRLCQGQHSALGGEFSMACVHRSQWSKQRLRQQHSHRERLELHAGGGIPCHASPVRQRALNEAQEDALEAQRWLHQDAPELLLQGQHLWIICTYCVSKLQPTVFQAVAGKSEWQGTWRRSEGLECHDHQLACMRGKKGLRDEDSKVESGELDLNLTKGWIRLWNLPLIVIIYYLLNSRSSHLLVQI